MTDQLVVIETALDKAQQAIITQSTPPDEIRTRQGRGGKRLSYVDHAYVTRLLNNAFAFNWDFETDEAEVLYVSEKPYEVKCRGKLTVRVGDMSIVKMQYGCQPLEFMRDNPDKPVSLGDAFKGAASDALKKCASLLGVALDLYDSDSDVNTGKQPQTKTTQVEQQAPTKEARPANGKPPYRFPNAAAEKFFNQVQKATGNHYEDGEALQKTLGGWFNFANHELWNERLAYACDLARQST